MVFDVDKLKEAVAEWDRLSRDKDARLAYPLLEIVTAARMVVAGQPLWWCEEHGDYSVRDDRCIWHQIEGSTCRMVEGWWMPTGKDET